MAPESGEWLRKETLDGIKTHLKRSIQVATTSLKLNRRILLVGYFHLEVTRMIPFMEPLFI